MSSFWDVVLEQNGADKLDRKGDKGRDIWMSKWEERSDK